MPCVISSDVRAAIWAHRQNRLSGQNISEKFIFKWNLYIKARIDKIIRERTLERQEVIKPVKRLGDCTCAQSVPRAPFWKWKISSTGQIFGRCERFPESWTSPSLLSGGLSSKIWEEKCDSSAKLITCQTRWRLNDWKRDPALSSISSTTDGEMWWVLMNFGVICHMWMEDGRFFMSFAENRARKDAGKFVYRSIHVEWCSSRESAPLVPLPFVLSLPKQKSTPTSTSTKFSRHFSKRKSPAAPRQRPSARGRGHRPTTRKFLLQFHSCFVTFCLWIPSETYDKSHGLQTEHLKSFFIHFVGWKKRNKVGHKDMAHSL